MAVPSWHNLVLHPNIFPEPLSEENRLVLWLPGIQDAHFHHWERLSTLPRAAILQTQELCAIPATLTQARQPSQGFLGKLWHCLRRTKPERTWLLPNGETAEPFGEPQTDFFLVWSEDPTRPLDEARIRSCWPATQRLQPLGPNLFLVWGIHPNPPRPEPPPTPPQDPSRTQAEQELAAARHSADPQRQAAALTDLGVAFLNDKAAPQAVPVLEEALLLARRFGDPSRESDVLGHLGQALLLTGQRPRALACFEQELALDRQAGDRLALKMALTNLGLAHASQRDFPAALASLDQAWSLAREAGDRRHQAEVLWYLAIVQAELGQRDQTLARGQASVELWQALGHPQAARYAEHLHRYRQEGPPSAPHPTPVPGLVAGPNLVPAVPPAAGGLAAPPASGPAPSPEVRGPGLLRLALTATKALAQFLGSGLKTVSPETHRQRLALCSSCPYRRGLRCRVCGCFTSAKAWLPYEECPLRKWPGQVHPSS